MRSDRRGFTLIELLLVVFILAMLAASTSALVDGAHDQARHDDTRSRLTQLRRAVLGPEDLTAPVAGYVADMGALPSSVRDLLSNPNGADGPYAVDATTGVGCGWRGPYLRALPRSGDGALEFPDGWGNADQFVGDPNFGWRFDRFGDDRTPGATLGADDIQVTSRGSDGVLDYAADASVSQRLERLDHHVDLGGWQVELTIDYSGAALTEDLALRVWEPSPTGLTTPATGDELSTVDGDRHAGVPLVTGTNVVVLQFAAAAAWVSQGVRAIELCRHDGTNFVALTPRQLVLLDLRPRASLPARLTRPLKVGP